MNLGPDCERAHIAAAKNGPEGIRADSRLCARQRPEHAVHNPAQEHIIRACLDSEVK